MATTHCYGLFVASNYGICSTKSVTFVGISSVSTHNISYCPCSWQTVIQMPEGEIKELPYSLKKVEPADRLEISQVLTMNPPGFICLT